MADEIVDKVPLSSMGVPDIGFHYPSLYPFPGQLDIARSENPFLFTPSPITPRTAQRSSSSLLGPPTLSEKDADLKRSLLEGPRETEKQQEPQKQQKEKQKEKDEEKEDEASLPPGIQADPDFVDVSQILESEELPPEFLEHLSSDVQNQILEETDSLRKQQLAVKDLFSKPSSRRSSLVSSTGSISSLGESPQIGSGSPSPPSKPLLARSASSLSSIAPVLPPLPDPAPQEHVPIKVEPSSSSSSSPSSSSSSSSSKPQLGSESDAGEADPQQEKGLISEEEKLAIAEKSYLAMLRESLWRWASFLIPWPLFPQENTQPAAAASPADIV